MSGIVSNASPLIYFAKVGKLDLLRRVFGVVYIPEEVRAEVVDRGKALGERDAYTIEKAIDQGWLKVLKTETMHLPIQLDAGEVAVLSLAKSLGLEDVLVDEASARLAARLVNVNPRGTVFALLKALKNGEIDLNDFLETLNQMIGHGFRLKEEVYLQAVREARRVAEPT